MNIGISNQKKPIAGHALDKKKSFRQSYANTKTVFGFFFKSCANNIKSIINRNRFKRELNALIEIQLVFAKS